MGIVVAIVAVIVPLVIQFAGKAEEGAKAAELVIIQRAIDNMMIDKLLDAVKKGAAPD